MFTDGCLARYGLNLLVSDHSSAISTYYAQAESESIGRPSWPAGIHPNCRCHLDAQTDRRLHSQQASTTATTQPKQRPDESRSPFFRLCWYPGTVCQIHPMEKLLALLAAAALLAACRVRSAGHGRNGDL